MKQSLILFILINIVMSVFSQVNIDSLKSIWNDPSQPDSIRLDTIEIIAQAYYQSSKPDSTIFYAQMEYEFAERLGDSKKMSEALIIMGISYESKNEYSKALENYNRSMKIAEKNDNKEGIADSQMNIGILQLALGDYAKAIDYLTRSLKIAEEIGNRNLMITILRNIGIIYVYQDDPENGLSYTIQSLAISEEENNLEGQAKALNNIGTAYKDKKDYEKAAEYFNRSLAIKTKLGYEKDLPSTLINIGMCHEHNGNYSKALEYLNKSLRISEEIEDKELIARSLRALGHVYHSKGDHENAINYNQRSLSILKSIKSLTSTQETAKDLYENYKSLGNHKQALEMHELYIVTRDSLLSERNKEEIIRQEYKYSYEKQAIIDSVAYVQLQKEQMVKLQKSKTQQRVLIVGVILLMAFLAYVYNRLKVIQKQKRIIDQEITERKKTEKALKEAKIIAEAATRAKGDFLANMSHEIRTPMNAILGLNHLLQKTDMTTKQMDYAKKIERSAQNLLGIINDILDFSKIEAGKIDMEEIDFNLNDVLDNLSNMMIVKAQQKDLELIISKATDVPPYLIGDPLRLGQILINLSTNAIKFTEKGEIEVKAEKIELTEKQAFIRFSVRDTGIGLTETQKGKLFQSFSQADTSTTRKYGGTGLGLTISKKLAELMGGEIGVDSVPGEGSTFYFTAKFGVSVRKKEKIRVIPEVLNNMNVLIVDDNETVLEVLSDYCHDFSFNVQTALNGAEALEILKNDKTIQTVFMDWKMPVMDGLEAATRIKNDPKIKPKPKIIMITSYGREEIVNRAEKIGLDGFLLKPVSQSLLLDTVVEAYGETITTDRSTDKKSKKSDELESIRGACLLLVEDNEINQQVAVELLESEGFLVDVADNGQIAVDMVNADREKYDLVLMDLQMPVMDGYSATKKIRENKEFDSLPIIAMTADAMSGVEENVLSIGMNAYVTKPIDVAQLYNTLIKWVDSVKIKQRQSGGEVKKVDEPDDIVLPDISGIDLENGLKRVAGNKKLYLKILYQFAENNRSFADELNKTVADKDQELAVRIAHTLKGVAGNLGAIDLFEAAKNLEYFLHDNFEDLDEINNLLNKVNDLLILLIEAVDTFRNEQQKNEVKAETIELNLDEVENVVTILKGNLEEYSTEATETYEKLKEMLSGHGFEMQMMEIEKKINEYDFESALESLEKLQQKIKKV